METPPARILPLEFVGSSCLPFDSGGHPCACAIHPTDLRSPRPPSPSVRDCELLGRISRRGRRGDFGLESGQREKQPQTWQRIKSFIDTRWMDEDE